jgi:hypothetical protein
MVLYDLNKERKMNARAVKYEAQVGKKQLNLYYHDNTLWLTLNNISELFNCSVEKVYKVLNQITKKSKITKSTCNKYLEITTDNGAKSMGNFYNLDIIMAVGYMLNPKIAMEFYNSSLFVYKNAVMHTRKSHRSFVTILKKIF